MLSPMAQAHDYRVAGLLIQSLLLDDNFQTTLPDDGARATRLAAGLIARAHMSFGELAIDDDCPPCPMEDGLLVLPDIIVLRAALYAALQQVTLWASRGGR
jgi:hypothetical protein